VFILQKKLNLAHCWLNVALPNKISATNYNKPRQTTPQLYWLGNKVQTQAKSSASELTIALGTMRFQHKMRCQSSTMPKIYLLHVGSKISNNNSAKRIANRFKPKIRIFAAHHKYSVRSIPQCAHHAGGK
jgi:hypothetical protein